MNLDKYFVNGLGSFLILTLAVVVIYLIIWYSVEKKIERFNKIYPERAVSIPFVASAVRFAYFIIGLIIIVNQVIPFKPALELLLDAGGILAICATFAARESIGNYIAGFLLTVHKPFRIGDRIAIEHPDISGIVKDITFRHTVIETESGSIVTVPNAIMNTVAIEDLSHKKKTVRKKKTS